MPVRALAWVGFLCLVLSASSLCYGQRHRAANIRALDPSTVRIRHSSRWLLARAENQESVQCSNVNTTCNCAANEKCEMTLRSRTKCPEIKCVPRTSESKESQESTASPGNEAVIGGVVGGIVALIMMGVGYFLYRRFVQEQRPWPSMFRRGNRSRSDSIKGLRETSEAENMDRSTSAIIPIGYIPPLPDEDQETLPPPTPMSDIGENRRETIIKTADRIRIHSPQPMGPGSDGGGATTATTVMRARPQLMRVISKRQPKENGPGSMQPTPEADQTDSKTYEKPDAMGDTGVDEEASRTPINSSDSPLLQAEANTKPQARPVITSGHPSTTVEDDPLRPLSFVESRGEIQTAPSTATLDAGSTAPSATQQLVTPNRPISVHLTDEDLNRPLSIAYTAGHALSRPYSGTSEENAQEWEALEKQLAKLDEMDMTLEETMSGPR
ncbi:uncharacterized protein VTP21DRAFT_3868 [Calcarisporiella thermophila]|uniref:uncharacterized protein n=1 Tax=Calcarisporiella thermophila TaxID=911321 RepID=UPI003744217D